MEANLLSAHWIWYSFLTVIGIGVALLSYRRSFPPLGRMRRALLAALRGVVVFLLGLFLIEPVINVYSSESVEPGLAVLMDNSGSMGDSHGSQRRIDLADSLRLHVLSGLSAGSEEFLFSDSLREVNEIRSVPGLVGDATSIAGALEKLASVKGFDEIGAALLITDGRQNLGDDPVAAAMKLNVPIYTLTVGEAVDEYNISVNDVVSPAVVYSGDEFIIKAHVSAAGIEARRSTVFLKLDGQVIADRQFDLPGEGRMTEVEVNMKATEPGDYEYTVSIPPVDGEIEDADNERKFALRVLKDKARVLLGSGSLNWEYKFIKQALSRFDDLEIEAVYPVGSGRFSSPGVIGEPDSLAEYDVIFLVDSPPSELRMPIASLKKSVDAGASLIYLAGADCLADIRQFDDLLPFEFERPELIEGEFFFEVSPTFRQHAVVLLDDNPDLSVRLWNSLRPFGFMISGVRPAGDVLLEAKARLSGERSLPVVTVRQYGGGRVAAVTGFPFWRSQFGSAGDDRLSEAIPKFWGNLVRWMAETVRAENFKVRPDRRVYRLGEPVRLTGYLYDEAGRPRTGAFVTVSIKSDDEETPERDAVLAPSGDGIYNGTISSLPPGSYKYVSRALSYDDTLGTASGEFTVEKFSLEMSSRAPDFDLTRRISEATGAVAYTKDDFHKFAEDLQLTTYVRESHARIKPFGMTIFLVIVLAGLAIEWGLRKRFRLP